MARTTVNIDSPLLQEIRRLQKDERKSMGAVISELLAEALAGREKKGAKSRSLTWTAQPMHARVDLLDHDAVLGAMDAVSPPR